MNPDWAAVVVAFGSLLVAGIAAVSASRSSGYARGQRDSAERQATAAEAQVEYMRRQVELMEKEPLGSAGEPKASLVRGAPYVPPWSVVAADKQSFALVNGGTEPAFDVSVSFDVAPARVGQTEWARIDPRSSVKVMLIRAWGASPSSVVVRWRRDSEAEPMQWSTALP